MVRRVAALGIVILLLFTLCTDSLAAAPPDDLVVSVTINWDGLTAIQYKKTYTKTWDPATHSYTTSLSGTFSAYDTSMTITNHSESYPITVAPGYYSWKSTLGKAIYMKPPSTIAPGATGAVYMFVPQNTSLTSLSAQTIEVPVFLTVSIADENTFKFAIASAGYLDGAFYFEDGMTWADWLGSSYNTSAEVGYGDGISLICNNSKYRPFFVVEEREDSSNVWGIGYASPAGHHLVKDNDLLVAGATYWLENYPTYTDAVRRKSCTVTFDLTGAGDGWTSIEPLETVSGTILDLTEYVPTYSGDGSDSSKAVFLGWYRDADLTIAADESFMVAADTTLYAKWFTIGDVVELDDISFVVMATNVGGNEDQALLLSQYILEEQGFDEQNHTDVGAGGSDVYGDNVWSESRLRTYLNSTAESGVTVVKGSNGTTTTVAGWLNGKEEIQQAVVETTLYTQTEHNDQTMIETTDKIFLLSEADVFGTYTLTETTSIEVTDSKYWSIGEKLDLTSNAMVSSWIATHTTKGGGGADWWWLRSPHYNRIRAALVTNTSTLGNNNGYHTDGGVRPALVVNINNLPSD